MYQDNLLKSYLAKKRMTQRVLAGYLGMSEHTLSRKMTGKDDWWLSELQVICKLLDIDDPIPIFFADIKNKQSAGTPCSSGRAI